ncbi:hypothetical protein [Streptomyces sp. NBC_00140]|uniref:hypothetical protein n=1 Tax=Streptomyces sp. NBC_00140 TaxID=2975664 RepID=UPI00224D0599|nr:hypothetical protein [Streptomyces sp. NBC_00140]MCX5327986.1 hypothetical protein [Streptomyces sp. NBC_00140]
MVAASRVARAVEAAPIPQVTVISTAPEWTLSPFLVEASPGLSEEALADETSEAAPGDVDGRLVGWHAEEFVQLTGSECLVGVLIEGVHNGLVGGSGPGAGWARGGSRL